MSSRGPSHFPGSAVPRAETSRTITVSPRRLVCSTAVGSLYNTGKESSAARMATRSSARRQLGLARYAPAQRSSGCTRRRTPSVRATNSEHDREATENDDERTEHTLQSATNVVGDSDEAEEDRSARGGDDNLFRRVQVNGHRPLVIDERNRVASQRVDQAAKKSYESLRLGRKSISGPLASSSVLQAPGARSISRLVSTCPPHGWMRVSAAPDAQGP